jgi:hypothetical protein
MMTLVCFLEEQSAKAMLQGLLPRLLPSEIIIKYVVFEGKGDLEAQLVLKLNKWLTPNTVFLVMRDQDAGDCVTIKSNLRSLCDKAGRSDALIRIACHELESFYFGDLAAVGRALSIDSLEKYRNKARYRIPDNIISPSSELKRISGNTYQKVSGSREIGKAMSLTDNKSHSYNVLLNGIKKKCGLEPVND